MLPGSFPKDGDKGIDPRNLRRSISNEEDPPDDGGDIAWDVGGDEGEDEDELCTDDEFIALNGGIENGKGGVAEGSSKFRFESIDDFIAAKAGNADGCGKRPPKGKGGKPPAAPAAAMRPKIPLAATAAAPSSCLFFNIPSVKPG